jgi:hypothetical protein
MMQSYFHVVIDVVFGDSEQSGLARDCLLDGRPTPGHRYADASLAVGANWDDVELVPDECGGLAASFGKTTFQYLVTV